MARAASAAPLSFTEICSIHWTSTCNPPRSDAQESRRAAGSASAASMNARLPEAVSNEDARAVKVSNFTSNSAVLELCVDPVTTPNPSPTTRKTFFTSSLPSVASFWSRLICSRRSAASCSRRLRARSRAASSSSGPSPSSPFPRRRFFFFLPPFLTSSSSSSLSEVPSLSFASSSSSLSSSPSSFARSSSVGSANTSSKGSPASPRMMCVACRAARQPESIAPPTVSGCSRQVCSPANKTRPSGRPSSS